MTRAPSSLLEVRSLLLTHLDVDQDRVRAADLEPAEVGIVGDSAHRGGYHCGKDRVVTQDYSVVESDRDSRGLTDLASALDVGLFSVTVDGRTHNLRTFSIWCVDQCKAGAPDTRDIREIIYSPDGEVVRRWDRLKRRATGDETHLWHTHISFFRDAMKAGWDQTPLFRRYLTTIGLLEPTESLEDGMEVNLTEEAQTALAAKVATKVWASTYGPTETTSSRLAEARDEARRARLTGEATLAAVKGLDTARVLARIDEVAEEERQRDAALRADLDAVGRGDMSADAFVDALASRLAGGQV